MPDKRRNRTAPSRGRKGDAKKGKKRGAAKKSAKRTATKGAARAERTRFVLAASDATLENLSKIDHIIVLLLENRSFDHMLGYLRLEGGRTDVDGLVSGLSNSVNGRVYTPHPLPSSKWAEGAPDPCHDGDCVTEQLGGGNAGFVSNYAKRNPAPQDPGLVMGYYNGALLPAFDHLSQEFLVCDRWFASVAGSTWPNRLYAVTGRADRSKTNKRIPLYNLPSFVRQLDAKRVSWRWYSHDFATLRLTDGNYRLGPLKNYYYFDRRTIFKRTSFLDHAASGDLPAVSWIDPNFVDLGGPSNSNDDHPPSDMMAGQELVLKLYNAVIHSPAWGKILLVITYDEHGGFYDHAPTEAAEDDDPNFRSYGVRVPALVVSPWVGRGQVSHTVFDHTSVIKTILLRFCRRADGSIPDMGARVTHANHLGGLLNQLTPREPTPLAAYQHVIERAAQWRSEVFKEMLLRQAAREAPGPPELNEFQEGMLAAKQRLIARGLPKGQP